MHTTLPNTEKEKDRGRVSIYSSPGRGGKLAYTVTYYLPGVKDRERHWFASEAEAKEHASMVPILVAKAREAQEIELREATKLAWRAGMSVMEIVKEYCDFKAELGETPLRAAVECYKQSGLAGCKKGTVEHVVQQFFLENAYTKETESFYSDDFRSLLRFLDRELGPQFLISLVNRDHLEKWLAEERARGLAFKTLRDRRASVVTLFKFARERRYLPDDRRTQAECVPKIRDPDRNVEKPRVPIFAPAKLQKLIDWLWKRRACEFRRKQLLFVVLACFSGIRMAELRRLLWKNIEFDNNWVYVPGSKAKTGRYRDVPMEPNLRLFLEALRPKDFDPDQPLLYPSVVKTVRTVAKRLLGAWPGNGFRHSYGTYFYARSPDIEQATYNMGTSESVFFARYRGRVDQPGDVPKYWDICPPGDADRLAEIRQVSGISKK